eukprot:COSAG03_NODE_191_length_10866_cov_30.315594_1_plen_105_part_00
MLEDQSVCGLPVEEAGLEDQYPPPGGPPPANSLASRSSSAARDRLVLFFFVRRREDCGVTASGSRLGLRCMGFSYSLFARAGDERRAIAVDLADLAAQQALPTA